MLLRGPPGLANGWHSPAELGRDLAIGLFGSLWISNIVSFVDNAALSNFTALTQITGTLTGMSCMHVEPLPPREPRKAFSDSFPPPILPLKPVPQIIHNKACPARIGFRAVIGVPTGLGLKLALGSFLPA